MTTTNAVSSKIDLEKFRLRTFVDHLIDMGEVEIHDEPVPLTSLGAVIERTDQHLGHADIDENADEDHEGDGDPEFGFENHRQSF